MDQFGADMRAVVAWRGNLGAVVLLANRDLLSARVWCGEHSHGSTRGHWCDAWCSSSYLCGLRFVAKSRSAESFGAWPGAVCVRWRSDARTAVPAYSADNAMAIHRFHRTLLARGDHVDCILRSRCK